MVNIYCSIGLKLYAYNFILTYIFMNVVVDIDMHKI